MNMSTRQPARRPLGPTKIDFNQNVGREFRWKPSLDDMGKFSATFSRFAKVIFLS
jgi:hypothetical protein